MFRFLCNRGFHNFKEARTHPAYRRLVCRWCDTKDYRANK